MQVLGDVNILSFFRISRLNWISSLITMDSKRKVLKEFNNNHVGKDE